MSDIELTPDQQKALQDGHGSVQGSNFVLMSVEVFRHTMGVLSENDMQDSLAAIEKSYQSAQKGNERPALEAIAEIATRHGLQS